MCVSLALPAQGVLAFDGAGRDTVAVSERPPHLMFKGIEIDGTPEAFLLELKSQGFHVPHSLPSGKYYATGEFAGEPDVQVVVSAKDFFVWKVSVLFPVKPSWAFVKEQYERFCSSYKEKFNVEPFKTERLSSRYKEGSGNEMWGFETGESVWRSSFRLNGGTVCVSVVFDRHEGKLRLMIDYVDYVNFILKREYELSDL